MAARIGFAERNIFRPWAKFARKHPKISTAIKVAAPVAGVAIGGGASLAAYGTAALAYATSNAITYGVAAHSIRWVASKLVGHAGRGDEIRDNKIYQVQLEDQLESGGKKEYSADFIHCQKRKISFLEVRIRLLEEHITMLTQLSGLSHQPIPEIETRLDSLVRQLRKAETDKKENVDYLGKERKANGDKVNSNGNGIMADQVIQRLYESVAPLQRELRLLDEFSNELKSYAETLAEHSPHLLNDLNKRISQTVERARIRQEELDDINSVAVKVAAKGLDPSGFEYVRVLGAGGMGGAFCFYLAKEDRFVAVKVNLSNSQPEVLKRFTREASVMARLDHAGIAKGYGSDKNLEEVYPAFREILKKIIDEGILPENDSTAIRLGTTAETYPYYITQLIRGISLTDLMEQYPGGMPIELVLTIAGHMLNAIEYYASPEINIVHRDLKPDNVLLRIEIKPTDPEFAKLIDFGIAKTNDPGQTKLTMAGAIFGTPLTLSHEQTAAHPDIDINTDLYALSAMIYMMLAGKDKKTGIGKHLLKIMTPTVIQAYHDDELGPILDRDLARWPHLAKLLKRTLSFSLADMHMRPADYESANIPIQKRPTIAEIREVFKLCEQYYSGTSVVGLV